MTSHVEKGRAIQHRTLGDDYWDRRIASTNDFTRPFREMTDEVCYHRAWADGPLAPKFCTLIVTTLLACMGRVPELTTHLGGAVTHGCTVEENRQTLLTI